MILYIYIHTHTNILSISLCLLYKSMDNLSIYIYLYVQIGRAKDQRKAEFDETNDRIKIEHRDKDGRLLTQKEAFRQVCVSIFQT